MPNIELGLKNSEDFDNCAQSGEISPNLVTM